MLCYLLFVLAFAVIQGANNFCGPFVFQLTPPIDHAECPTWDGRRNVLYYVDIHVGNVYSYDYQSKDINFITLDGTVAPVLPSKSDENLFMVGLNRSLIAVEWDGKSEQFQQRNLLNLAEDKPTSRSNDGKADKKGRIWFGTMGSEDPRGLPNGELTPNEGALYKISNENGVLMHEVVVAPVNISNGAAWNRANDKFYYIDSPTYQIAEYDYNDDKGIISNRRTVFDLRDHNINAIPDGMTIDKDDNLWVALYGGGSVIQVNPKTGELMKRIPIPADFVTSVMWGGPDLDVLFVTTSRRALNEEQRMKQPGAGSLYAVTILGTKGLPVFEANIIFKMPQ